MAASKRPSRVSSRICALAFFKSAAIAPSSSVATIASVTCSPTPWRREMALSLPEALPTSMISRRSWSLSRGENSSTGQATTSSASRARRWMTWLGAEATSLRVSATIWRTRVA